jgi:hypothetical protein
MIYQVKDILDKLENAIKYKLPFSHIRFGDGGLKFIYAMLVGDRKELISISEKEGLPYKYLDNIFYLWGRSARCADFIDTPEVYFNNTFWPRVGMSTKTEKKMREWKFYYDNAEFDNEKYCNPESNYLMIIKEDGRRNLFDVIKNKKICIISIFPELRNLLYPLNVEVVEIVPKYKKQFDKSFKYVIDKIKNQATYYDVWLVAAGELGRIYSGTIKECGGRAVDIGAIVDTWVSKKLTYRMRPFLIPNTSFPLELVLTDKGKKYGAFI